MASGVEQRVFSAMNDLLTRYQSIKLAVSADTARSHKDTTISTAEDINSLASMWLLHTKRRWNRTTPIHRLPTEILVFTFRFSTPTEVFEPITEEFEHPWPGATTIYYDNLLALCGVSSDWARIVRNTPSFWVYVSSGDHPKLIDLALKRSQKSPLWIHYFVESSRKGNKRLHKYLQTTLKESHRWHTLVPDIEDGRFNFDSTLKQFSTSRFPSLARMLVSGSSATVPNLFPLGCPAPKYIEVKSTYLEWGNYQLSNLETFRLFDLTKRPALSFSQLLDILKASPSLATFEVTYVHISDVHPDSIFGPMPTLPALHFLKLSRVKPSEAIRLLLPLVDGG
ncbi:hypothetical protein FRB99_002003 [Tulasnella sp. 403]|nr:hypothetical protein FRB99_002003 [Tulasnella sp. 403]